MTRLSRRDRAALVLAYEELRDNASGENRAWRHGACTRVVARAKDALGYTSVGIALRAEYAEMCRDYHSLRLLRCRLALAIRAILRADAGDFGPTREGPKVARPLAEQTACAASHGFVAFCCVWEPRVMTRLRYVPLWEQARA